MATQTPSIILAAVIALALTGCGSGSSSDSATEALTQTSGVTQGTVTGFGSVFVNGVEWETDGATVSVDDQPGSESDLKVGHVVVIHGTHSSDGTSTASSIEHDAEVEGTISFIDSATDTLVVAGLTITVNADTVFDDSLAVDSLEGLALNDYVEVSALPTADGYLATRIDLEVDDGKIEVSGQVANLDTMNSTFMIHDLVVDYSSAGFEDFGGLDMANDDHVEVHGSGFGTNGELLATIVEYEDHNPFDDGSDDDEFEIEGIITAVNLDGSFVMSGVLITLAPGVTFEHGSAGDLIPDAKVEAEGEFDAVSNSLVANHIEFKIESTIKVEAPVQFVDSVAGTVTVLGIVFNTSDTTQLDDDSVLDVAFFDLADLMQGEWVEIRAFVDDAGDVIATRVERDDAEDEVELEGPVESVMGDQVTILGVTLTTDALTQLDAESPFASVADLLGAIVPGTTIVEVDGLQTDTAAITVSEIEIED